MKNLTIAQGLKEKNKLATKLSNLWKRLNENNSVHAESIRDYEPDLLMTEINDTCNALILLKTAIHQASNEVRDKIFRLSELKSKLVQLRALPCKHGMIKDRYNEHYIEMDSYFKKNEIDGFTEALELEIEKIQEELDTYNHTTKLSV